MLKCLLIRRKLYDYLQGALSEIDRIKVKGHLDICDNCRERVSQLERIIELTEQKSMPEPDHEFWHNFRIDLDRRLNERLVTPVVIKRRVNYRLVPVFAYTAFLIFILAIGISLYRGQQPTFSSLESDQELIEEIVLLDEIDEPFELDSDENAFIEEINLLYQLS